MNWPNFYKVDKGISINKSLDEVDSDSQAEKLQTAGAPADERG